MGKIYLEVDNRDIITSVSNHRPSSTNYTIEEREGIFEPYDLIGLNISFADLPVSSRPKGNVPEDTEAETDTSKSFSLVKFAQLELDTATVTKFPELIRIKQANLDGAIAKFNTIYKE